MPKLSDTARATLPNGTVLRVCPGCNELVPLSSTVERCSTCAGPTPTPSLTRAQRAAALPVDAFDEHALTDIYLAGCVFAEALADINHHYIGDPGSWDCYSTGPDELSRLHAALDQLTDAIKESRARLTRVERRVRRAAAGDR
jgi:hypothetical protein